MHLIRSFFIAFAAYSKIPVPQFAWKEEDMKYMLCFFPWVGAVIGGCIYLWNYVCGIYHIGVLCYASVGGAVPLLITGGFHGDGFLDTVDALHSYQSKERKLEILKDAHIGAFAVLLFAVYGLVYIGAFSEIKDGRLLNIACSGFFLSRCLSGIGVVSFPAAKKEGMLHLFAGSSHKKIVKAALYLQSAACIGFMLFWSFGAGLFVAAAALAVFAWYYRRCRREFGGITGDTAGYFVLVSEVCMMAAAAAMDIGGFVS